MARAVYSTRFLEEVGLDGLASYTVPAGFTAVLRDLDAYNASGIAVGRIFLLGHLGQTIWFAVSAEEQDTYQSWRGRQVLLEGEKFTVNTEVHWDVTVSGYLLTLP